MLLIGTGATVLLGYGAALTLGRPGMMDLLWYGPTFAQLLAFLLLPLPIAFLWGRLKTYDTSGKWMTGWPGWRSATRIFIDRYLAPARVLRAVLAGLALCMVINTYGAWKAGLTVVAPFRWDRSLAEWDRVVHLGMHPWAWLHPLLGTPSATLALDWVYFSWLPLLATVLAWQVWSLRNDLRNRFFLTSLFVWIGLGNVGATLLSSAGPPYFHHLVPGPNPYGALFEYLATLEDSGLLVLQAQDMLWGAYQRGASGPYTGISAMPSVHVGMTVLYALVGWAHARWLGVLFAVYSLLTLIATIHLGWHYAVDGYASIVAVALFWWVTHRRTRSVESRAVGPVLPAPPNRRSLWRGGLISRDATPPG